MTRSTWCALFALAVSGCGGSSAGSESTAEPVPVAPPDTPAAPGFTVHEWGLVDVTAAGTVELAAGPGQPEDGTAIIVRKPVLYVRLDPGLDAVSFGARVTIPGGAIVEHWPPGEVDGSTLAWPRVEATPSCAETARDLPVAREAVRSPTRACDTPDGYCEVADLPGYVAEGSACLHVGSEQGTLLFYRASLPRLDLPLQLTASGDAVNARASADGVGELLRITRQPNGLLRSARVAAPAAGATVALPAASSPLDAPGERARMAEALRAHGLTDPEAEAFLRAWAGELFEPITARVSPPVLGDVVLYWLPRADVDRMAPLALEPPPRELARAILVRVEL